MPEHIPKAIGDPAIDLERSHRPHSPAEDVYAFLIGSSFIVIGIVLLHTAGLITGGMAGIALLVSQVAPIQPALLLLLLNIPFFLLARRTMGTAFMVKTIVVNLLVTALAAGVPNVIAIDRLDPWFAAIFGGTIIGMGILSLARHGAGVGGSGVVALSLQKAKGWNAGKTQLIIDIGVLAASLPILDLSHFALSALSAAAINAVLMVNHRPGRYTGY